MTKSTDKTLYNNHILILMTRRIITFFAIALISLSSFADSFTYEYEGVTFKGKIDGGYATIKSFDNKAQRVVIPATVAYKGTSYPVESVGVFMNGVNYSTVYLTLEEGIKEIDKFCFNEFRKLREVKLPASLRRIGKNAFRNNSAMQFTMLATIPEGQLRQGNEINISDYQLTAEMQTAESPDMIRQREKEQKAAEKEQRAAEKDMERQLKEKDRQLKEAEKEKARLLAEAEKRQKEEERERAKAEQTDKDDDGSGIKGMFKSLLASKKKDKPQQDNSAPAPAAVTPQQPLVAQAEEVKPQLPPVDVDIDIPVVKTDKNLNTYCVIIANENYEDIPVVDYASRDGEVFREYCIKTLGVPEKQIKSFINASYTDIKRALNWVETMTDISEGNSKVIFYYAGHGIPDEKEKASYLIPTDGFPKDITTCFKLGDIYARLGKLKTQNVTVLLDACFSGVKRGSGQALIAARGVALKPRAEVLPANMVVFTAASDDETALSYGEKRHGMFTYFLLDRLKKSKGETSFGDLFMHLSQNVKKSSMLENDKLQTPNVAYSTALGRKWESMTF